MSDFYPDCCVLWPGRKDRHGYGIIGAAGEKKAHRLIYTMFKGPIPKGLGVLHSCDTPACVNPKHLRVGTQADNARDMVVRGRSSSWRRKLTDEQIQKIRGGMSYREAIAQFGIQKSAYYSARNCQTYRTSAEFGKPKAGA